MKTGFTKKKKKIRLAKFLQHVASLYKYLETLVAIRIFFISKKIEIIFLDIHRNSYSYIAKYNKNTTQK